MNQPTWITFKRQTEQEFLACFLLWLSVVCFAWQFIGKSVICTQVSILRFLLATDLLIIDIIYTIHSYNF